MEKIVFFKGGYMVMLNIGILIGLAGKFFNI